MVDSAMVLQHGVFFATGGELRALAPGQNVEDY